MSDDILSGIDADDLIAGLAADAEDAAAATVDLPAEGNTASKKTQKKESVDQTPLDKKAGLNKFRDLEKLREEQRKQQEEEQEAEKKRKGAYSGKKWEVTKPAGPVRPQDAGQLKVAEAVRPSNQKLSPREEIEEQTRRAREKRCLSASGPAGPVTPPQGRSSLTSGDTTPRGVHEDGTNKEASSPGSKSLEPEGDEEAGKEEGKGAQDLSEKLASAAEALKAGTGTNSPHVEETEAKSVDHQPEETTREGGPEDQRRAGGREGEKGGADTGDNGALSRGSSQDEQGHRFSSEFKAEVEKFKQKVPGFLVCYNKKGVKEPRGGSKSSVALETDEAGEPRETDAGTREADGNDEQRPSIHMTSPKEGKDSGDSSTKEEAHS